MNIFWPAYQNYTHKGGKRPIWDLYSADQKNIVLEMFSDPVVTIDDDRVTTMHRDMAYFTSLANLSFLNVMCTELGFPDVIASENALRGIKFTGSPSIRQSWVMYKTAWDKLLKQMTPISQLSDKTLVKIFKDGIPDAYFKTCFDQQNHRTWTIGYEWCKDQLKDHNFLTGYTRHADKSLAIAEAKHQSEIETLKREVMQLKQSKQSTSTPLVTPPAHSDNSKKDSKKNLNSQLMRSNRGKFKEMSIQNGTHQTHEMIIRKIFHAKFALQVFTNMAVNIAHQAKLKEPKRILLACLNLNYKRANLLVKN